MSAGVSGVNRVVLAVLGLLLVVAGGLGLALSAEAFGSDRSSQPVISRAVQTFPADHSWFWWAVAGGCVLIALLTLRWLVLQTRTKRTTRLDRTVDARDGHTLVQAGALTAAMEEEAAGITGVTGASAQLRERPRLGMMLRVDLSEAADVEAVRSQLEDEVVAHLREAVDEPDFPVALELRPETSRSPARLVT